MSATPQVRLLPSLRRHRHLFGVVVLSVMALWLAAPLAHCLVFMSATPSSADMAPMSGMGHDAPAVADMLCADCTLESGSMSFETAMGPPTTPKLWFAAVALFLVGLLLPISPLKTVPIPPQPRLPKRPRTLKFYALRI